MHFISNTKMLGKYLLTSLDFINLTLIYFFCFGGTMGKITEITKGNIMNWKVWVKLLCSIVLFRIDTNNDLLITQGTLLQCYAAAWMGEGFAGK